MSQKTIIYQIVKVVYDAKGVKFHESASEGVTRLYTDELYYSSRHSALVKLNQLLDALHIIRCRDFSFDIIEIEVNP